MTPDSSDIQFKNVNFQYVEGKSIFENVSFTIPSGKKVAIVGGSGCGYDINYINCLDDCR